MEIFPFAPPYQACQNQIPSYPNQILTLLHLSQSPWCEQTVTSVLKTKRLFSFWWDFVPMGWLYKTFFLLNI